MRGHDLRSLVADLPEACGKARNAFFRALLGGLLAAAFVACAGAADGGHSDVAPGEDSAAEMDTAGATDGATAPDAVAVVDTFAGVDAVGDVSPPADAPADAASSGCAPRVLGAGEVRAKWIGCADELVGGPHALGAVGDILLENARVRFVVRAASEEGVALLGTGRGGLIDADRVRAAGEAGEDRLREILPIVSLNVVVVEEVAVLADGAAGEAVVRVTGHPGPLPLIADVIPSLPVTGDVTVDYVLRPDEDHLTLRTTVAVPAGGAASRIAATDVIFLAGDQPLFLPGRPRADNETWDGPFVATMGGGSAASERAAVSYGYAAAASDVQYFDMGGSLIFLGASRPVRPGEELVTERWFVVGDGSVSSVTDPLRALRGEQTGLVRGTMRVGDGVAPCGYRVHATDGDGGALTTFDACPDGTFAGRLPVGNASLVVDCDGCAPAAPVAVTVAIEAPVDVDLVGPPESRLAVTVRDADGLVVPARLTLIDLDHPERRRLLRFSRPARQVLRLAPGRWQATVTRGFEYELAVRDVVVPVGGEATLDVTIERSVATPGAVAADFHMHSELSADSSVPRADRALACAAEGLEFVTPSEHDFVGDYGPFVAALGLAPFLATVPGVEVSSIDAGHHNVWPMTADPTRAGAGAPYWFGLSPPALVAAVREGHPERIVQVNHPRYDYGSAFEIIGFDPTTARATATPEALGFPADTDLDALPYDAIEVFNGIGDERLAQQLEDWYALLNVGRRITATAGGDSHSLDAYAGNPRNFVLVADDDPASLGWEAVADAVRAMRVVVSSGPYIEAGVVAEPNAAPSRPGEVVSVDSGDVRLRVRVQAPSWMAVDDVRVIANGHVAQTIDLRGEPADGAVRVDTELTLPVDRDTWFVVIAEGAARHPFAANLAPFAITNPYFVDADGDGSFTPPGLPAR